MDIEFWKMLPRHTTLTLLIEMDEYDTKTVYCKYFHSTETEIYCSYFFNEYEMDDYCTSFLVFDDDEIVLNTHESIIKSIQILEINKTDELPLVFSFIDKKYVDIINSHYKELHLAHNYLDQGWTTINEEELETLNNELKLN